MNANVRMQNAKKKNVHLRNWWNVKFKILDSSLANLCLSEQLKCF